MLVVFGSQEEIVFMMDLFLPGPEKDDKPLHEVEGNILKTNFRSSRNENKKKWHPNNAQAADSLHKALRLLLLGARYIALFPVLGINSEDAYELRFHWLSKPMFYSLLSLGVLLFFDVLIILRAVNKGLNYSDTVEISYYVSYTFNHILFLHLAIKWPKFAYEWQELEKRLSPVTYVPGLQKKFKIIICTVSTFALIEIFSAIATQVYESTFCVTEKTNIVDAFFMNSYTFLFMFVTYNATSAVFVAVFHALFWYCWHFVDIFIIVMSVAMSDHYKKFNQTLSNVRDKTMPPTFWRIMRETYNHLSCLTKLLDELLSPIILLSFGNNLYFICLQLFNSLKPMASTWHAAHFVYSFSYLVLRTLSLSLFAASISDQSKRPKAALFCVPSESYCAEVERLLSQVIFDDLALTGCRFFSVTRTLVLTVAGTIVTYEIVLVQFNSFAGDSKQDTFITCQTY